MDILTCILNDNAYNNNYFPATYLLPQWERPTPQALNALPWANLPTISLAKTPGNDIFDRYRLSNEVLAASESCGMFQVVDHNISESVLSNALTAGVQFFNLPNQQLHAFMQPQVGERTRSLYSSSLLNDAGSETRHFWRDALTVGLNSPRPAEGWPNQPPNFQRDIWQFSSEVQESVETKILQLIAQGLGLKPNYFAGGGFNDFSTVVVNRYPRCPEPTWTCGLPKHADPTLLTISFQGGANGLQIWRDNEWKLVVPSRNALLVTLGQQMEVISNGRLRAPEHRVIVNSARARTSISYFTSPTDLCMVAPALGLTVTAPPLYRQYQYREFIQRHLHCQRNMVSVLPYFRI